MPTKYLRIGDTAIHYQHAGPTTLPDVVPPLGRGAAVLLLHGEGGCSSMWTTLIAQLGDAHSPIAIDLPAHGRSCGLEGPATVDDGVALLDGALEALGAPPIVVVGHGLGGHLALALAARRPARVRSVVAVAAAARTPWGDDVVERLESVVQGRQGQFFDTPYFGDGTEMGVMRSFWGEMVKTDPRVRLGDMQAYGASDLSSELAGVAVPTVIVRGSADKIVSADAAEELAGAVPGARLVTVEGAGHVAHLENPDAIAREIGTVAR